jgi:subtilase family serine protease
MGSRELKHNAHLSWLRSTLGILGKLRSRAERNACFRPLLECLEHRTLLSASATGGALPALVQPTFVLAHSAGIVKGTTPQTSGGFTPQQIRHAYGFDQISFNNGTIPGDGRGETIAIVDAYNQPNLVSDLATFDQTFGLPAANLQIINQTGGAALPTGDSGWGLEISLDVEWAHAIAPGANILLVEANSNSGTDLLTAVDTARNTPGVAAVSMSWGSEEFSGQSSYDTHFQTPSGHPGVTFVASSGDEGAGPSWPAASPYVLAVGGTSLTLSSSNNWQSEVAWSGSGGGISEEVPQPTYQAGLVSQSTTSRTSPDVAFAADPNAGFAVCDSAYYRSAGPWIEVGGTSAGAPQWSALLAIAHNLPHIQRRFSRHYERQQRLQCGAGIRPGHGSREPCRQPAGSGFDEQRPGPGPGEVDRTESPVGWQRRHLCESRIDSHDRADGG